MLYRWWYWLNSHDCYVLNQLDGLGMPQPVHFSACHVGEVQSCGILINLKGQYPNSTTKDMVTSGFPHEGNVRGQDYDIAGRLGLNHVEPPLLQRCGIIICVTECQLYGRATKTLS